MSDTLQESPVENYAGEPPNGSGGNRRLLVIVAGVAGLLVIAAAAYFLFLSGGSSDEALGTVPGAQPAPSGSASSGTTDKGNLPKPVKKNFKAGHNPFKLLPAEAPIPVASGGTDTSSTDTTGTSTGTSTGTTTGTGTGTSTGTGTGTGTTTPTTYMVHLSATNTAKKTAKLQVNGKNMTVKVGELFPNAQTGPLKLIAVSAEFAKFEYADGTVATLAVGAGVELTPPSK